MRAPRQGTGGAGGVPAARQNQSRGCQAAAAKASRTGKGSRRCRVATPWNGWRRGRDSNPRRPYDLNGFRDRPIQPLSHLSTDVSINLSRLAQAIDSVRMTGCPTGNRAANRTARFGAYDDRPLARIEWNFRDVGASQFGDHEVVVWFGSRSRRGAAVAPPNHRVALKLEPGRIVLIFDAVAGGLVIRPGQAGSGFEIVGADERSVPAGEQVRDQPLVGSSPAVPALAEVCYALSDAAEATLFNSAGLPASSFGANAPAAGG